MTGGLPQLRIVWQMDRAIFDKSAASLMIPLQLSNGARCKKVHLKGNSAAWAQTQRNSVSD
jgi:hypothetical protein